MSGMKKYLLGVAGLLLAVSCSPQPEDKDGSAQIIAPGQKTISGVSSKGPISGALIEIIAFNASDGYETGVPIATANTNANGRWEVSIPATSHTEALLIKSSGGEYLDESDPEPDPSKKRTISFAADDAIYGALFPGFSTASITMMTSALIEKARIEANGTDFLNVLGNNRNIAANALGFDPFTVGAANPLAPASSASIDAVEYAMLLGGMATALNSAAIIMGKPVPDFAIIQGFIQDMTDGRLNGTNLAGPINVDIDGVATPFPTNIDLNQAITRFRNNNYAAYAVTQISNTVVSVKETVLATSGVNSSPTAQDNAATTIEGSAVVTPNVLLNDTDPDGDSLTISSFTQPANGQAVNNNNGSFTYTPNPGFSGSDIFSYTITDGRGGSDTAQVIVTVNATSTNSDPVAVGDVATTDEDVAVTTPNVLSNDTDADGDTLTITNVTVPANGTVADNGDGTFTYTPTTGFSGIDSFSYSISDGNGGTDSASVTIAVAGGGNGGGNNVLPTANAGIDQSVNELSTVTLAGSGLDSDGTIATFLWSQVNGTPVTITNASSTTASFSSPEVLVGNIDVLVFQLTVTDNSGGTGMDFVTVIANPVAIAPTANAGPDQTSVPEQTLVTLDGSGSTDDISISTYAWTQLSPASPTATLSDSGAVSPTFTGPDIANNTTFTFQLTVTDNEGGVASDTVSIGITSGNIGPTGVDDIASTPEDTPITITNLLANDTDVNGNNTPFTITGVNYTGTGSVFIEANNTDVTYTPGPNFNGTDSFTYTSQDSLGADSVNAATVTVTVSGSNDDPVANPDTGSTTQGIPVTLSNLTANDTDPENDPLSISGIASQPANGSVVNNGDGTITYTPLVTFNGDDSFTYSIVDGTGGSATGTVTITVIADTDGDSVIDSQEAIDGTDPNLADTDGDGFFDGHEKLVGTNAIDGILVFPPTTTISTANSNNTITTDTTWGLANSPYLITSDVNIQSGATLTIEPGVVVKSNLNVDIFVNSGGILDAQGNAPVPQHVVFTSALDDQINGDTNGDGVATSESDNDWGGIDYNAGSTGTLRYAAVKNAGDCIRIVNSSPVIDNVEVGDCQYYGIDFQTSTSTRTANLSNVSVNDYDTNGSGQSTGYSGIRIYATGTTTTVLNLSNLTINDPGAGGNYGLYIYANGGSINGSIDAVTVIDPANDGIHIWNSGSGDVDLALSNLSISGSPSNSLEIRDSYTTNGLLATTIDGTNTIINNSSASSAVRIENNDPDFLTSGSLSVNAGGYGMNLVNSAGNFNNITLDNISIAGIRLANASDPFEFSNVVLTNAITPYELVGQDLTATITGGYDFSDPSVSKSYIRVLGSILADMTLDADPLGTGTSVWRVPSSITVPSAVTLTISDDAIVKIDASVILYVDGTLSVTNGAGGPAILTSILDDTVGGDSNGDGSATVPARGNWGYINARANSSIAIDTAIVRYMQYGIYQANTNPTAFTVSNTTFTEFTYNGLYLYPNGTALYTLNNNTISNGSNDDGLYLLATTGDAVTLNIDGLTIDNVGNNTSDHGMNLDIDNSATLTGTINNVTIGDSSGAGIYLDARTGGVVNPTFTAITINGPIGTNGMQLVGDSTTTPTLSNININAGQYNLTVQGIGGSFSNMNLDGATVASIYLGTTATMSLWDDATIILTNAPAPFQLATSFPASVGTLGTTDLGYNTSSSTITENYISISGTLANLAMMSDPLNTGNSVWRVIASTTIPSGVTLTISDDAIIKFNASVILYVDGTLSVTNGGGGPAILTSILDDTVGGDSNGDSSATVPARGNWGYINARANSSIAIDTAIVRYMQYGIYQANTNPTAFTVSNTTFTEFSNYGLYLYPNGTALYTLNNNTISNGSSNDGLYLYATTGDAVTLNIDGLTIDNVGNNTSDHGMNLDIDNSATLTGTINNVTIGDSSGAGIFLDARTGGAVNPTFTAITINGPVGTNGMQLIGDNTTTPTLSNIDINAGQLNLTVQGISGSFSNMNLDGATAASLWFDTTANPSSWDDTTIVLTNAPSPYHLLTALPASVGILGAGTVDLGYNTTSSTVTESYIRVSGTLSNMTLMSDPLNTGSSVWRMVASTTIPSGVTLTITDDAIVKIDASVILYVDGTLSVTNAGGGPAVFTSILDDSVGDDLGDVTPPARGNWGYINARANSSIAIDTAIVRYMQYGIYQANTNPTAFTVSNTTFTEFTYNGLYLYPNGTALYTLNNNTISNGSNDDGLYLYATTGDAVTLNIDGLTIDNVGNNTSDHGMNLDIDNSATLTGTINNVTIGDSSGAGIFLDARTGGVVNPTFTAITINGPVGTHGMQLIGDSTTTPTLSNININAGQYNLTIQGIGGSFSNMILDGATISSIYFDNNANPSLFDSATITLSNSPSPYTLVGMNLPALVGYTSGAGLVEDYVVIRGPISSNMTILADPLATATGTGQADDPTVSYWYSPASLLVNNSATLTIGPSTLMKFAEATYLQVESTGVLNINGTSGNEVYLTSFSDNAVNDPVTSAAVNNDWYGIYFRTGSSGGTLNFVENWYAYYGVYFENVTVDPSFNDLSIHYPLYGLYFYSNGAIAPGFNNISIEQASRNSIWFGSTGSINPGFTGTRSIYTRVSGGYDCIYNTSSSPNILISGWTIDGCSNGIDTRGAGTYVDNLIRNASGSGIYVSTSSAITIGNNRIVNNGTASYGGGIDIRGIGSTSVIENNLIRHNSATWGGGISLNGGTIDLTMRNNLVIENHATSGTGGIYVLDNSTVQLINNTIAGNTSAGASDPGVGLRIFNTANNVTYTDNLFIDNRDSNSLENIDDISAGSIDTYNIEDGASTNGLSGTGSQTNAVPDFTEGWYLGALSDAIDAGSDLPVNLGLTGTTTQTLGTLDGLAGGASDLVDIGFHYTSGSTAVSAANSTLAPSDAALGLSETVTITITPRDASTAVVGYGLDISISAATGNGALGTLIDLGDGSYQVNYTSSSATSSDTLTFTVNGVILDDTAVISW